MSDELQVKTTPDKPANYEVSVPGEEGFVAFSDRKEMFKYMNMKLNRVPGEDEYEDDEVVPQ